MAYDIYQSRFKGYEIDDRLAKVDELDEDVENLKQGYDASKIIMPDNSSLPDYLANYDTSDEVDEKIENATYTLPVATTSELGGVKPDGTTIIVDTDGTLHGASQYELPVASETTLGGVKVDGTTITADADGTLHGASAIDNLDDIGDVNVTSATDGQALVYDATNDEWIPGEASGSGLPNPSASDKMLISNDDLEWEEIDKDDVGTPTWTGTKEEYEAAESDIPDGTIVNITNDDGNMVGARTTDVYSTDETVIGKWVDGKPIYRKVFTNLAFKESSSSWNTSGNLNTPNIKDIINYSYIAKNPSNQFLLGNIMYNTGSMYISILLTSESILSKITTSDSNWKSGTFNLILEYTKTTD